jgi:hypothetical protein
MKTKQVIEILENVLPHDMKAYFSDIEEKLESLLQQDNQGGEEVAWFLERKDTNEWYYPTFERKENLPCTCRECFPHGYPGNEYKTGWTNDPNKAWKYKSREEVEENIRCYVTEQPDENLMATEHLFTSTPPSETEEQKGMSAEEINRWLSNNGYYKGELLQYTGQNTNRLVPISQVISQFLSHHTPKRTEQSMMSAEDIDKWWEENCGTYDDTDKGFEAIEKNVFLEFITQFASHSEEKEWKRPTGKQLIEICILFNDGKLEREKLADMLSPIEFVLDRLFENGDVTKPSSKELPPPPKQNNKD